MGRESALSVSEDLWRHTLGPIGRSRLATRNTLLSEPWPSSEADFAQRRAVYSESYWIRFGIESRNKRSEPSANIVPIC